MHGLITEEDRRRIFLAIYEVAFKDGCAVIAQGIKDGDIPGGDTPKNQVN